MNKTCIYIILILITLISCETSKKEPASIPFSRLDNRLQYLSTFLSKDIPKTLNEIEEISDLTKASYFAGISSAKINRFSDDFNFSLAIYKTLKINPDSTKLIEIKGNNISKTFYYKLKSENETYQEIKLMNEINLNRKLINFNVIISTKDKVIKNKSIFPEITIKF